ncbi:MAG: CRTAC1 family protein, partial [Limisphaerales bacterium]
TRLPALQWFRAFPAKQSSIMNVIRRTSLLLAVLLFGLAPVTRSAPIRFRDVTDASGIRFVHTDGSSGQHFIVETIASGLGLIDYDGDGYPDILFLNGSPLPGARQIGAPPTLALYHNNRDGKFTDVSAASGLGISAYAVGCVVGDYDNDGHEDVFITCYGGQHLFHNNGDGTFSDVTAKAGLADPGLEHWIGAGCVFLDYDRDGYLDLFVAHYLEFDPAHNKPSVQAGVPNYIGPGKYPGLPSRLYHNNRDGTFTDVSKAAGIAGHVGYGMGIVSADFDGDGWPDVYVGNDVMENFLFHNKKDGTFEEIGVAAGAGYDSYGEPQGTMGVNVGDFDGDGRFDIIVTKYQNQVNTLYRNLGNLQFRDLTVQTGMGVNSRHLVTWGCGLVDFDNDGVPEFFAAAGHLQDTVEQYDKSTTYKERSLLLRQSGGRFSDVTAESGDLAKRVESSRGAVFGDLNNDGKLDIVILNSRSRPTVLLNDTSTRNHWVTLKLVGTRSNRSAVGALARLSAGGRTLVDEVRAWRGYQSAEDLRLHFGLGTNTVVDRLEVRWPSGITNSWTGLKADQILRLEERAQ